MWGEKSVVVFCSMVAFVFVTPSSSKAQMTKDKMMDSYVQSQIRCQRKISSETSTRIRSRASEYRVPSGTLEAIIVFHTKDPIKGAVNRFQDFGVTSGFLLSPENDNENLEQFQQTQEEDDEKLEARELTEARDSWDHAIFASLGPAQIQVYTAMKLYLRVLGNGVYTSTNLPYLPSAIAEALTTTEGAIEFLAAEIQWMIETYASIGLDISDKPGVIWQLHNGGNVEHKANIRKHQENPEPLDEKAGATFFLLSMEELSGSKCR